MSFNICFFQSTLCISCFTFSCQLSAVNLSQTRVGLSVFGCLFGHAKETGAELFAIRQTLATRRWKPYEKRRHKNFSSIIEVLIFY
ncbi:hypothetical protein GGI43DRAFT_334547 [Trichoderma evansii]